MRAVYPKVFRSSVPVSGLVVSTMATADRVSRTRLLRDGFLVGFIFEAPLPAPISRRFNRPVDPSTAATGLPDSQYWILSPRIVLRQNRQTGPKRVVYNSHGLGSYLSG